MIDGVEKARRGVSELLESGSADAAAKAARSELEQFPDDPSLTMLLGLAELQQGRIEVGTGLLKQAVELDPSSPEGFHNLALALYNQGEIEEAALYAREALRLDSSHEGALETLTRCETPAPALKFEVAGESVAPSENSIRAGLDSPVPQVLGLGEAWTKVGYAVVAYDAFCFAYILFRPFVTGPELKPDPAQKLSFFFYVTMGIATVIWTLADIIDRREKFVWLLPMWICGASALPVLPLVFYMAMRKRPRSFG